MPPQPAALRRADRDRRDARRSILEQAARLLRQSGADALTMRRVAARSGCSAPTLYHYFRDKQGLLDAVLDARLRLVLERLRDVPTDLDPAEAVRRMLSEFARFGLEHPTHHRLLSMHRPEGAPPPPAAEEIGDAFEALFGELGRLGRLRGGDVEQAIQFIWMVLHGIVSLRSARPDVEWKQWIVDYSLDTALRGLLTANHGADGEGSGS